MSSEPCILCSPDPSSYLFKRVSDKNNLVTFYTHPSKARQFKDHRVILEHVHHLLGRVGTKKSWRWIIDGDGFDTDHLREFRTAMDWMERVVEHLPTLKGIHVINPSVHLKVLLKVIHPFLLDDLRPKIQILDDRTYSILEFL